MVKNIHAVLNVQQMEIIGMNSNRIGKKSSQLKRKDRRLKYGIIDFYWNYMVNH